MRAALILIQPLDLKTSQRVDVRAAVSPEAHLYGAGGFVWHPAVSRAPELTIELMSPELDGRVQSGKAAFNIALARLAGVANPKSLMWRGAPVTIYSDAFEQDLGATPEFYGLTTQTRIDNVNDILTVECEVPSAYLDRPLLRLEFDGGNGLGGGAARRGQLKPAGFGSVKNIEPVWIDDVRNIGMIDGYGNTLTIDWLAEGLSSFGPRVADYPTFAALAAAIDAKAIAPGRWATCVAEGLIGLGAPPAGVITCHATFGGNLPGSLINRWLQTHAEVPVSLIDTASLTALNSACPYPVHHWTKDQETVRTLIEALAASCNATPLVTFQNRFSVIKAAGGTQIASVNADMQTAPRPVRWVITDPIIPFYRIRSRAARPARVIGRDDVRMVDTLVDRGLYDPAVVYRPGNIVALRDGSSWVFNPGVTPIAGVTPVEGATWHQFNPAVQAKIGETLLLPSGLVATAADIITAQGQAASIANQSAWATFTDGSNAPAKLVGIDPGATRNAPAGAYDAGRTYQRGDIVSTADGARSYIAKQSTPAGTPLTNTAYFDLLVQSSGGAAGQNAFQASLSRPAIVIPTNADGTGGDYSQANGQLSLWEGSINRTSQATFTKVTGGSWVSIDTAGQYVVGDPGADAATAQFDASYGSVTYRVTLSVVKARKGAAAIQLVGRNGVVVDGNSLVRQSGSGWNADGYSVESWVDGAMASFAFPSGTLAMAGLNIDPGTDGNFTSIDRAFYIDGSGTLQIYENGGFVSAHGAVQPGDLFSVHYVGGAAAKWRYLRHRNSGTEVLREVPAQSNLTLYFDSSIAQGRINNISVGPGGAAGKDGAAGVAGTAGPQGQPGAAGANGQDGVDGRSAGFVFLRSATQPVTPPAGTGTPSGWFAATGDVPAGAGPVWSSAWSAVGNGPRTYQTPLRVEAVSAVTTGQSVAMRAAPSYSDTLTFTLQPGESRPVRGSARITSASGGGSVAVTIDIREVGDSWSGSSGASETYAASEPGYATHDVVITNSAAFARTYEVRATATISGPGAAQASASRLSI